MRPNSRNTTPCEVRFTINPRRLDTPVVGEMDVRRCEFCARGRRGEAAVRESSDMIGSFKFTA